jgi:hypothetical protein
MKQRMLALVLMCFAMQVVAQEAAQSPTSPDAVKNAEEGYRPLFDGKSFAGWRTTPQTQESWKIEDGLLKLTGGTNHLFAEEEFADFIVRVEWRAANKGYNSGFFVRGRQIQLAQSSAGMLFGTEAAPKVPHLHKPPGEWNQWEVTCVGSRLALKVNGELAWEITDFKPASGRLGIEAEGHAIDFRNIRIKAVESKPSNTPNP